jgi:Uma2 family endonuclease
MLRTLLPKAWYVSNQQPIELPQSEPEPDILILRGSPRDYRQHPRPVDVGLLIEVSDTSLVFDRSMKMPLYAQAGINEYWIVNLIDRQVEIHREPQPASIPPIDQSREIVPVDGQVDFKLDGVRFAPMTVADFLP